MTYGLSGPVVSDDKSQRCVELDRLAANIVEGAHSERNMISIKCVRRLDYSYPRIDNLSIFAVRIPVSLSKRRPHAS
jgi:hypothetical protein